MQAGWGDRPRLQFQSCSPAGPTLEVRFLSDPRLFDGLRLAAAHHGLQ